jgi:hypothetical protein
MTTKEDLHNLVNELPENAWTAAEAFLAFLRDRSTVPSQAPSRTDGPGRLIGQDWADNERRGIEQRRQDRDDIPQDPEPDKHA